MSSTFRFVAPAGAPIRIRDLVHAARMTLSAQDAQTVLVEQLQRKFGINHVYLTSTGRAGMTLLLRALRRKAEPGRDEVIVPSYTCYSVAASVVKAGLRPRLVDIDPATLDYQLDGLDGTDCSRVLAVVACNLYGYPNDLAALRRFTRRHVLFLVDDAAQAMGARVGGTWCGTGGDFGLYSFDKGKNVAAIDGGVVVTNDPELAAVFEQESHAMAAPRFAEQWSHVAKAAIYSAFLRPSLYWIPNRIPQLGLGKTVFTTDFPLDRPASFLSALATRVLPRLEELTERRTANAAALAHELAPIGGVTFVEPGPDATPAYLRLPVLLPDRTTRNRALDALTRAGIGASASYPMSLADLPELRPVLAGSGRSSGGRYVADRILTLPTHAFVGAQDISRIVGVLRAELGRGYRQATPAA